MTVELVTTPYGAPSHEALRSLVDRHQRDDRLAPVTVVVPSNYVGIAARRALGRSRGVAAVTFLTTYRLAELLGAGRLAATGRRPPVVAARQPGRAVRSALDSRIRFSDPFDRDSSFAARRRAPHISSQFKLYCRARRDNSPRLG